MARRGAEDPSGLAVGKGPARAGAAVAELPGRFRLTDQATGARSPRVAGAPGCRGGEGV